MSISTNGDSIMIRREHVDLKKLILEVIQSFKPRLDAENASVNFSLASLNSNEEVDFPPVSIDKLHIQGVLINLLDNSLKYSAAPAQVNIEMVIVNKDLRISVSDRGIGIPSEYRSKIFEKFFRVPTGDQHNIKGYGLGLTYAEMVMKEHKGSIMYREREGGGSTFILSIPIDL